MSIELGESIPNFYFISFSPSLPSFFPPIIPSFPFFFFSVPCLLSYRSPAIIQENVIWKHLLWLTLHYHDPSLNEIISRLWQPFGATSESTFSLSPILKELDPFSDSKLSKGSILVTYNSMIQSPSKSYIPSKIMREN